ncbi:hypothetical protein AB0J82_36605 [Asanoa sp. NPDC049518]|uniref:hypothetical protein n=1 Tax=unclassified Asanoa TaxID=2685164 RepID=UPI0034440F5E
MTTHPPHHTPPDQPGGPRVAPVVDAVPGDPPVPITVWRTARSNDDHAATIPARLAARLVAAYSRPGDPVVDLTADHALAPSCTVGRRRHHRAWFTDTPSLVIGPPSVPPVPPTTTPRAQDRANAHRELCDGDRGHGRSVEPAEIRDWFGDDLTDPHLPPTPTDDNPPPAGEVGLWGRTSLVVAGWPLHADPASNRVRLAWLLTICQDLLRAGGCLVLVVAASVDRPTPEDFTPIVTAATAAGLGYLQHIVGVAADLDGDTFTFHATDEELLALAAQAGRRFAHLRIHADLLVLTPRPAPSDAAARERGDHG